MEVSCEIIFYVTTYGAVVHRRMGCKTRSFLFSPIITLLLITEKPRRED